VRSLGIDPEWVHVSEQRRRCWRCKFPGTWSGRRAAVWLCLPARYIRLRLGFGPGPEQSPRSFGARSHLQVARRVPKRRAHRTPLGYGAAFHTRRTSRIATVRSGYADGLSRQLSNRGCAIVRQRSARIVGNISMDLTLLDLPISPALTVGDEVTLVGRFDHCLEIAQHSAPPLRVLCSIGKRVPRIYVD